MVLQLATFSSLASCIIWPVMSWVQVNPVPASLPAATSYVVIDSTWPDIHHIVTERTGEQYIGINPVRAEIYNILRPLPKQPGKLRPDTLLISLSILPAADGPSKWTTIRIDTLPQNRLLSLTELEKRATEKVADYFRTGKPANRTQLSSNSIIPIIKNGQNYYLAGGYGYVLTSFFIIKPNAIHALRQADMATIDSKSPLFPVDSLLTIAARKSGNTHAQAWAAVKTGNILQSRNKGYYEFWSNPQPVSHADLLYYGLDKFLYKSGIGIVSGKYESFFTERNQFVDDFFAIISIDGKRK